MYKSFRVKNYRCFKDLTIGPLERVNLIAGKNNVGKTALLEALWLHQERNNPAVAASVTRYRGLQSLPPKELLASLVSGFDLEKSIEICATDSTTDLETCLQVTMTERPARLHLTQDRDKSEPDDYPLGTSPLGGTAEDYRTEFEIRYEYSAPDRQRRESKATVYSDGTVYFSRRGSREKPWPSFMTFLTSRRVVDAKHLAELWSDVVERKDEGAVIDTLRIIEPALERLLLLQRGGRPVIYADVGLNGPVPIALSGEGMGTLLLFALSVPAAKDDVFLVDEIENGLHYSVMKDVWKALAVSARRFDIQIFATTHSHECIRAAHEAFCESPEYDFRMHRLDRIEDTIQSVTYDREGLAFSLEAGWEVR